MEVAATNNRSHQNYTSRFKSHSSLLILLLCRIQMYIFFFLVNSQLDASSCYVDFNCHFSSTVPGTSFRVYYFVKFNCGSSDFRESLSLALQACLPIIDDLSRSAMRPRHWKQLLRVTGGAVHISNEGLTRMTLGQLLELGLHGKLSPPLLHNSINAVSFASSK